jgi:two-component system cell cycle sensor histidine kinase/response regulator CckA
MPKGGKLHIATSAVEITPEYAQTHPGARTGAAVCLEVTDTGTGMDRKTLGRIFEPFFSTKEVGKGTGLGLATVYGIVKQHQGWIEVKSEIGRGTTFLIYLPTNGKGAAPAPETVATSALIAKGRNETILLVEDEAILREWVKEILTGCNYEVLEAANGVEALKIWDNENGRIDLLVTDMVMPEGMTGGDLARQLIARQPQLKVIYTSGYSDEIMGNDTELPDGPFLPKPYAAPKLAQLVRDCLDAPEAAQPVQAAA